MSRTVKYAKEIKRLLPIRQQFILSGNVDDQHIYEEDNVAKVLHMDAILWNMLENEKYECIVKYNPVNGISILIDGKYLKKDEKLEVADGLELTSGSKPSLQEFASYIKQIVLQEDDGYGTYTKHRVAILIEYASRISRSVDSLSEEEYNFFRSCDQLARDARRIKNEELANKLYNPVIWCVQNRFDIPVWYGAGNNRIVFQEVEKPSHESRSIVADLYIKHIHNYENYKDNHSQYVNIFAGLSEGLKLQDMIDIMTLVRDQKIGMDDLDDAARGYKTGNQDVNSPWRANGLKERVDNAKERISSRVKGQPAAIELSLDILKRSIMGLTGAQTSSSGSRPRGVLFLAGPTGVGKTELAKSLTQSIFGSQDAYIRFDMSEFASEHSEARLIGAPPGYVGYESGGELTKAVRSKPFSLILFDEIEKAHPKILDKFLQILEDGRITDGLGDTVFFSESIIVFTSNLGISKRHRDGTTEQLVHPQNTYEEVRENVLKGIEEHFTNELRRPEILNRLGDNIVVFNFIQKDVAIEIFEIMVNNIKRRVKDEHRAKLELSEGARNTLIAISTSDLKNGGRGIGSKLESSLVNPLARKLFELESFKDQTIIVDAITMSDNVYSIKISVS
ncbi:AAA family ATPase [Sulfurimonas aquatica]|nr:AAA family ATPase [Sulfurimonas aquatica]